MVDTDVVVIGMYVSKLLNTAELELWIELGTEKIHAVIFLKIMEKKAAFRFWKCFLKSLNCFKNFQNIPSEEEVELLERFVIILYDRTNQQYSVNNARIKLFSKGRPVENILPSGEALEQHKHLAQFTKVYIITYLTIIIENFRLFCFRRYCHRLLNGAEKWKKVWCSVFVQNCVTGLRTVN